MSAPDLMNPRHAAADVHGRDGDVPSLVRALIEANAERVFGAPLDELRIERLVVGRPRHRRHNRHHRLVVVRYAKDGASRERRIWLKFLTHVRSRYERYETVWERTSRSADLFARPLFFSETGADGTGVIGMDLVQGPSLRNAFLASALVRRSATLGPVFAALGAGLRAFHDSWEPSGIRPVADLEETARRVVAGSGYLSAPQRRVLLDHVAAEARRAGAHTALPLVPVHNDCTLRNVIVRADGRPCLLDLDSIHAAHKSRWHDVVLLLVNIESQIKYAPLVGAAAVAAAWRSVIHGYLAAGMPDGLSAAQLEAVLYLVKIDYLLAGPWRPLYEIYARFPSSRYLPILEASILRGEHLIPAAAG